MEFPAAVGRVLRRLRTEKKLTLHGVQDLSDDTFKASALSGYERGERSISLERFKDLTRLYSVRADVALKEVLILMGEADGDEVIDLTEASVDVTEPSEMSHHPER